MCEFTPILLVDSRPMTSHGLPRRIKGACLTRHQIWIVWRKMCRHTLSMGLQPSFKMLLREPGYIHNPKTFSFKGTQRCVRSWLYGDVIPTVPCWPMPACALWKSPAAATILSDLSTVPQWDSMGLDPEKPKCISNQFRRILWHHSLARSSVL